MVPNYSLHVILLGLILFFFLWPLPRASPSLSLFVLLDCSNAAWTRVLRDNKRPAYQAAYLRSETLADLTKYDVNWRTGRVWMIDHSP